jgi:nucleotide-binding universal stress UspA family protein
MDLDILLPILTHPDVTSRVGLGRALHMSAKLSAKVHAILHEVDIPTVRSALGEALLDISRMTEEAEVESRRRAVELRAWTEERAERLRCMVDVVSIRCQSETLTDQLLLMSRRHDLAMLVLGNEEQQPLELAEALVFGSGGPVIVVPSTEAAVPVWEERSTPMNVCVAWDGTREAARALRDAIPILKSADTVSIITINDDKPIDHAEVDGVVEYLAHHNVQAQHLAHDRGVVPIGEALQNFAISHQADLLVMGAYGHNRVQQFILGGATRTALRNLRLPILLSH